MNNPIKTYEFPDGTTNLTKSQIKNAVCNYEKVVFPGSMLKVELHFGDYADDVKVRTIEIREGVQTLKLGDSGHENVSVDVPDSIVEIHGTNSPDHNFLLPKVLCFPKTARLADFFHGVEYLQAYSHQDVRFFDTRNLKHYVYLGEKPSLKKYLFDKLPERTVIHVQNRKMAEWALGKVDVEKIYVIPDAKDWQDFPAAKLAMTLAQYDPESRILPKQKELRAAAFEEKDDKDAEMQRAEVERDKWKKIRAIVRTLADNILPFVCSAWITSPNNECTRVSIEALTDELKLFNGNVQISGTMDAGNCSCGVQDFANCVNELKGVLLKHKDIIPQCAVGEGSSTFNLNMNSNSIIGSNCHGVLFYLQTDIKDLPDAALKFQGFITDLDSVLSKANSVYGIDMRIEKKSINWLFI